MRAYLPDHDLVAPPTLAEVLERVAAGWRPLAGGTDLMVLLEADQLPGRRFVSLWHLDELRGIESDGEAVTLGALTTMTDLREDPALADFPMLRQAAGLTGGVAIQNRATVAGNIANASPAADSPPALLAYGAELILEGPAGRRVVAYDAFHTGYKTTALEPGEIIRAVRLPRPPAGARHFFRKVGPRRAQAISKVVLAALVETDGQVATDVRIAVGSVAPVPLRCRRTEDAIRARPLDDATRAAARRALEDEIAPIDDIRSTADYRRRVAGNVLVEALRDRS